MATLRRWGLSTDHVDLTAVAAPRPAELAALPQNLTIDVCRRSCAFFARRACR
jgi:hypothetical protein